METICKAIQCKSCGGTGVYRGCSERGGAAVVCRTCKGTGCQKYVFKYEPFAGRKIADGVERVYQSGAGYCISTGQIDFDGVGVVDMDKEGVSYDDFLNGKAPGPIKSLGCPMIVDQSECHRRKGFVDECNKRNGGWINYIPRCTVYDKRACWDRFESCEMEDDEA